MTNDKRKPITQAELQRKLGSSKVKIIPSWAVGPSRKPPSRVDRWRAEVKARKEKK